MRMIIAHEKHGDRYLDASTDEALAASAKSLLAERMADGYWYEDPDVWDKDHPFVIDRKAKDAHLASLSEVEVARFPDRVQQVMIDHLAEIKREAQREEQARAFLRLARKVIDDPDPRVRKWSGAGEVPQAWALLLSRAAHEYESVALVNTEGASA